MKKIFLFILIIFAIFLRLYNLNLTARFTRDESSDLVAIKNIYQNKKITLIGPMDEGKIEVFSSLTYYLLLPFCMVFGFSPIITAYGTAFYGLITIIIFAILLKKIHWSYPIFILSIIFTPLLVSSRWAWNPHFVPLWQVLSLLILFSNRKYKYLFAGLLMGLTIHQHWYAVFTALALFPIILIFDKKRKIIWQYPVGLLFSILPFILFDLTHPPGLFITRMLYFSPLSSNSNHVPYFSNFWQNISGLFQYMSGNQYIFGILILAATIFFLIFYRTKNNLWLFPLFFHIICLSFTHSAYHNHYILPTVIFYLFWLYKNQKYLFIKLLTILLIIFNLLNLSNIINSFDWTQNIQAQEQITNFISKNQITDSSFNLIVLQSPDSTTKGYRFKDQLKLKNISLKDEAEYNKIDTLYVISYEKDWAKLSEDHAYELDSFRKLGPLDSIKISNSDWFVYKLSRTGN